MKRKGMIIFHPSTDCQAEFGCQRNSENFRWGGGGGGGGKTPKIGGKRFELFMQDVNLLQRACSPKETKET